MRRTEIAKLIVDRLLPERERLRTEFATPGRVPSCAVDNLLPEPLARQIFEVFPQKDTLMRRHDLKESKYFTAQLNRHSPLIEELVFAFQEPSVVQTFSDIVAMPDLLPDPRLYAGGVSLMVKDSFLNPHLDNSHDSQQKHYRVLNSLYYVTPDWTEDKGGNLELWDQGPEGKPRTILSLFNRLVLMATNRRSWHSVTPVVAPDGRRTCVSNYFFREKSLEGTDYFHATSFRGRPEQRARDLLLRADNLLRTAVLSVVKVPTKHIYKR